MNARLSRVALILILVVPVTALLSGCATGRPKVVAFPYTLPAIGSQATGPTATIESVVDSRADRSLDMYLSERPTDFLKTAVAAEFVAAGTFSRVETTAANTNPISITADLRDLSWEVPNHDKMVKTAMWTSLLTGGLGGLAYGSTETPVLGHASIAFRVTDKTSNRTLFDETVEVVHLEKMAKLKCDTLETKAQVMAAALKDALTKAAAAIYKARTP